MNFGYLSDKKAMTGAAFLEEDTALSSTSKLNERQFALISSIFNEKDFNLYSNKRVEIPFMCGAFKANRIFKVVIESYISVFACCLGKGSVDLKSFMKETELKVAVEIKGSTAQDIFLEKDSARVLDLDSSIYVNKFPFMADVHSFFRLVVKKSLAELTGNKDIDENLFLDNFILFKDNSNFLFTFAGIDFAFPSSGYSGTRRSSTFCHESIQIKIPFISGNLQLSPELITLESEFGVPIEKLKQIFQNKWIVIPDPGALKHNGLERLAYSITKGWTVEAYGQGAIETLSGDFYFRKSSGTKDELLALIHKKSLNKCQALCVFLNFFSLTNNPEYLKGYFDSILQDPKWLAVFPAFVKENFSKGSVLALLHYIIFCARMGCYPDTGIGGAISITNRMHLGQVVQMVHFGGDQSASLLIPLIKFEGCLEVYKKLIDKYPTAEGRIFTFIQELKERYLIDDEAAILTFFVLRFIQTEGIRQEVDEFKELFPKFISLLNQNIKLVEFPPIQEGMKKMIREYPALFRGLEFQQFFNEIIQDVDLFKFFTPCCISKKEYPAQFEQLTQNPIFNQKFLGLVEKHFATIVGIFGEDIVVEMLQEIIKKGGASTDLLGSILLKISNLELLHPPLWIETVLHLLPTRLDMAEHLLEIYEKKPCVEERFITALSSIDGAIPLMVEKNFLSLLETIFSHDRTTMNVLPKDQLIKVLLKFTNYQSYAEIILSDLLSFISQDEAYLDDESLEKICQLASFSEWALLNYQAEERIRAFSSLLKKDAVISALSEKKEEFLKGLLNLKKASSLPDEVLAVWMQFFLKSGLTDSSLNFCLFASTLLNDQRPFDLGVFCLFVDRHFKQLYEMKKRTNQEGYFRFVCEKIIGLSSLGKANFDPKIHGVCAKMVFDSESLSTLIARLDSRVDESLLEEINLKLSCHASPLEEEQFKQLFSLFCENPKRIKTLSCHLAKIPHENESFYENLYPISDAESQMMLMKAYAKIPTFIRCFESWIPNWGKGKNVKPLVEDVNELMQSLISEINPKVNSLILNHIIKSYELKNKANFALFLDCYFAEEQTEKDKYARTIQENFLVASSLNQQKVIKDLLNQDRRSPFTKLPILNELLRILNDVKDKTVHQGIFAEFTDLVLACTLEVKKDPTKVQFIKNYITAFYKIEGIEFHQEILESIFENGGIFETSIEQIFSVLGKVNPLLALHLLKKFFETFERKRLNLEERVAKKILEQNIEEIGKGDPSRVESAYAVFNHFINRKLIKCEDIIEYIGNFSKALTNCDRLNQISSIVLEKIELIEPIINKSAKSRGKFLTILDCLIEHRGFLDHPDLEFEKRNFFLQLFEQVKDADKFCAYWQNFVIPFYLKNGSRYKEAINTDFVKLASGERKELVPLILKSIVDANEVVVGNYLFFTLLSKYKENREFVSLYVNIQTQLYINEENAELYTSQGAISLDTLINSMISVDCSSKEVLLKEDWEKLIDNFVIVLFLEKNIQQIIENLIQIKVLSDEQKSRLFESLIERIVSKHPLNFIRILDCLEPLSLGELFQDKMLSKLSEMVLENFALRSHFEGAKKIIQRKIHDLIKKESPSATLPAITSLLKLQKCYVIDDVEFAHAIEIADAILGQMSNSSLKLNFKVQIIIDLLKIFDLNLISRFSCSSEEMVRMIKRLSEIIPQMKLPTKYEKHFFLRMFNLVKFFHHTQLTKDARSLLFPLINNLWETQKKLVFIDIDCFCKYLQFFEFIVSNYSELFGKERLAKLFLETIQNFAIHEVYTNIKVDDKQELFSLTLIIETMSRLMGSLDLNESLKGSVIGNLIEFFSIIVESPIVLELVKKKDPLECISFIFDPILNPEDLNEQQFATLYLYLSMCYHAQEDKRTHLSHRILEKLTNFHSRLDLNEVAECKEDCLELSLPTIVSSCSTMVTYQNRFKSRDAEGLQAVCNRILKKIEAFTGKADGKRTEIPVHYMQIVGNYLLFCIQAEKIDDFKAVIQPMKLLKHYFANENCKILSVFLMNVICSNDPELIKGILEKLFSFYEKTKDVAASSTVGYVFEKRLVCESLLTLFSIMTAKDLTEMEIGIKNRLNGILAFDEIFPLVLRLQKEIEESEVYLSDLMSLLVNYLEQRTDEPDEVYRQCLKLREHLEVRKSPDSGKSKR